MSQSILGIDLGTYSIKATLLQRRLGEIEVAAFWEQPLSASTRLSHDEQAGLALEQLLDAHPVHADLVCVALPGHLASCRVLELPVASSKRLNQIVEFELENYVPFEVDDLIIDFFPLERKVNRSDVLCVYMPEKRCSAYLEKLQNKGIDPKYLTLDLVDLSIISQVAMVPDEGCYLICDIGHSKTNICLLEGRSLRYARTIGVGGLHFTRAIQRAFNLNYEKAEALKLSRGKVFVRQAESDQVSLMLGKIADELVSGIKQTLLGFESYAGIHSISAIYCCGGGSRLPGLNDYLSFHLKTNVLDLDPLALMTHRLDTPEEVAPIVVQSLATALRPVYPTRAPRINLRKGPFAFKRDIQLLTGEIKQLAAVMSAVAVLGGADAFYTDHFYDQRMAAIDKSVEKIVTTDFKDLSAGEPTTRKRKTADERKVDKYTKLAKSKLSELKSQLSAFSGDSGSDILTVMAEISKKLPAKKEVVFEVNELTYADGFIRLKATTDKQLNLDIIEKALQSDRFTAKAGDARQKPGGYEFDLQIELKKPTEESTQES